VIKRFYGGVEIPKVSSARVTYLQTATKMGLGNTGLKPKIT